MRALTLLLLLLTLSACTAQSPQGQIMGEQQLARQPWSAQQPLSIALFSTDAPLRYELQLALHLDTRLELSELPLELRLSYRGKLLQRERFTLALAASRAQWQKRGLASYEYACTLARPLHIPHTGLFSLSITPLISGKLRGISALSYALTPLHPSAAVPAKATEQVPDSLPAGAHH